MDKELFLLLIDKGLLALILALVAGLVSYLLNLQKANHDLATAIAEKRATAYEAIWKATEPFRKTEPEPATRALLAEALTQLNKAYFQDSGALYLSWDATQLLQHAKSKLTDLRDKAPETGAIPEPDFKTVRDSFSALRTQLKQDLMIYSKRDAQRRIG